ncbi:DUF58 domain-containing protein [Candidatus Woesearchaeota archaeon]|nr:DUF58 domain-containing protein [Candidatus Woesearchaeota archaeon]
MPLREFKAKLVPEIKELNVYVKKNLLSAAMTGELMSSLKGRGVEFEDYRDYTNTDDAARIDWRASKRSQRLLVREYKLEINFSIFFLVDVSESMLFSSTSKLKCEYAAEVVTSLFYGILQIGNSIGFGLFNTSLFKIAQPLMGKKQFYYFTREISNPGNYGGEKNLAKAMQQVISILDRKSLIIIVSDFLTEDDTWIDFLKIMAQKHQALGIMIRDPRDLVIPEDAGQIVLEDPYSKESIYVDAKQYSKIYEEHNLKKLKSIRSVFQHNAADLLELTTDKHYLNPTLEFFKKKGGRWR